jgi:hypothetical protein
MTILARLIPRANMCHVGMAQIGPPGAQWIPGALRRSPDGACIARHAAPARTSLFRAHETGQHF